MNSELPAALEKTKKTSAKPAVENTPPFAGQLAQLIAHHTVNGCNLQPGDLLGTGTISSA